MFEYSLIQSLDIFGTWEEIYFVFQSLEVFEILLEKFKLTGTQLSARLRL
jgi:hypothetical protein